MSTITRPVRPQTYVRDRIDQLGLDGEGVRRLMEARYGVHVASGHFSEILRGKKSPTQLSLFAMLAVLGLRLEDWGLEPWEAPVTWLALEAVRLGIQVPPATE